MLKVMIVDDEYHFRKALGVKIEWEKLGFVICAEAKNGEEALERLEEARPDVALVDINMPVMDGLGFIAEVRERGYPLEMIIITGYGEFEYAKQAISLGIRNYLLKPVEEEELVKELRKVKSKIEKESGLNFQIGQLKKQVQESIPILREKLLNDLIYGAKLFGDEEVFDRIGYLKLNLKGRLYRVALFEIDNRNEMGWDEEGKNLWNLAVANIIREIVSEGCNVETCMDNNSRICALISFEDENVHSFDFTATNLCERIRESVEGFLGFTVTVGLGRIYNRIKDIAVSYKESSFALRNKLVEGTNKVIAYDDINESAVFSGAYSMEQRYQLLTSMRIFNPVEIEDLLDRVFNALKERSTSFEFLFSTCVEIISTCVELIAETEMRLGDIFPRYVNLFEELQERKSLEDVRSWIKELVLSVGETVHKSRKMRASRLVLDVKKYLQDHLGDSEFKAENLSRQFFLNYSYISHVFSKETGRTVSEYLTEIRVRYAKDLIDGGDHSIYSISEKSGYVDPNYFSRCFKKYFGMTPTKYIQNITGKG